MRIEAGRHVCYGSDDRYPVYVDRPLSRSQVDVIVQLIHDAGYDTTAVWAIELDEGGARFETDR